LVNSLAAEPMQARPRLTRNQIRGFWAAWGGWTMDGMDSFIYSLVLVPAMLDLLPKSGIPPTTANVGFYGGLLFALFLVGWGIALIWGPIADRFGRVRTLTLTILWFSFFTFLSAFSPNIWCLAIFRLLAGVGIGGEWSMGALCVTEDWPEERRTMGVSLMHTGYYFGFFLAALANYLIGNHFGWRSMFIVGGVPALLVAVIRRGVNEPKRWEIKKEELGQRLTMSKAFLTIFSTEYRRRTILNSIFLLVSIIGLWGGSVYVPAAITYLAGKSGRTSHEAVRLASYGTTILAIGTIIAAVVVPLIADRIGRRTTLGGFFALMGASIAVAFGYVFYLPTNALLWFMVCVFFLGLGGASFIVYSFWLPEQYGTECRASAFAFTTNIGRFAGAGFTFLVGAGIRHYQTLGTPVALTALAFVVGILLLPFGKETKGKILPS
jgi:MFS family permease